MPRVSDVLPATAPGDSLSILAVIERLESIERDGVLDYDTRMKVASLRLDIEIYCRRNGIILVHV